MDARTDNTGPVLDDAILRRIERFLYEESALLDRRDYRTWWKTLTDDIEYRVTAKVIREASLGSLEYALIDERAAEFKQRVDQISTPRLTHAENPPTVTRRYVTNVTAQHGQAQNEFQVSCNLLVYRSTIEVAEGALYSAAREDVLREVDGEFRIARRLVRLDQALIFGAVSILF